jgi:hypothetical protein
MYLLVFSHLFLSEQSPFSALEEEWFSPQIESKTHYPKKSVAVDISAAPFTSKTCDIAVIAAPLFS